MDIERHGGSFVTFAGDGYIPGVQCNELLAEAEPETGAQIFHLIRNDALIIRFENLLKIRF